MLQRVQELCRQILRAHSAAILAEETSPTRVLMTNAAAFDGVAEKLADHDVGGNSLGLAHNIKAGRLNEPEKST